MGNFLIPYVVNGEFLEIILGIFKKTSGNTGPVGEGACVTYAYRSVGIMF
jgi:hypothetical protein